MRQFLASLVVAMTMLCSARPPATQDPTAVTAATAAIDRTGHQTLHSSPSSRRLLAVPSQWTSRPISSWDASRRPNAASNNRARTSRCSSFQSRSLISDPPLVSRRPSVAQSRTRGSSRNAAVHASPMHRDSRPAGSSWISRGMGARRQHSAGGSWLGAGAGGRKPFRRPDEAILKHVRSIGCGL